MICDDIIALIQSYMTHVNYPCKQWMILHNKSNIVKSICHRYPDIRIPYHDIVLFMIQNKSTDYLTFEYIGIQGWDKLSHLSCLKYNRARDILNGLMTGKHFILFKQIYRTYPTSITPLMVIDSQQLAIYRDCKIDITSSTIIYESIFDMLCDSPIHILSFIGGLYMWIRIILGI